MDPFIFKINQINYIMKHLLCVILILTAGKASSQVQSWVQSQNDTLKKYRDAHAPVIAAKDAYNYIGRMVILHDSLYTCTIINDTTVACQMGEKANTPRLTLLVINKQADISFFNNFKRYRIWIWGTISGTKDAPILILRSFDTNFHFDAKPHGTVH